LRDPPGVMASVLECVAFGGFASRPVLDDLLGGAADVVW
jgi:hypothetical protein